MTREGSKNYRIKRWILLDKRLEYCTIGKDKCGRVARGTFEKIEPLIEKITDEDQKELTQKMYDTMINRYDAYEKVYENYTDSIRLTKELYTIYLRKKISMKKRCILSIGNVNDSYEEVLKANELFNQETVLYNHLKQEYYDMYQRNNIGRRG